MIEDLDALDRILQNINHPFLRNSEQPMSKEDLLDILISTHLYPRSDLITFYSWKGGINGASIFNNNYIELCSYGCYIDMRSAVSLYLLDQATQKDLNQVLPIIQSNSGDFIGIALNENSCNSGKLLVSSPSITLSDKLITIYDSLHSFVKTILNCYEQKAYVLNESVLVVDYEKEAEISGILNPSSDFWKE